MRAGRLRHRVNIQSRTQARNAHGEMVDAWLTTETRWAGVEPMTSRERFDSQQVQGEISHRIVMRHVPGLDSSQRIEFKGRRFEIVGPPINKDERNREMELMVKEATD